MSDRSQQHLLHAPWHIRSTPVQCVALDPQADRVAAGDMTGRINIWHQLRTMHKEVDRRACHLCFWLELGLALSTAGYVRKRLV